MNPPAIVGMFCEDIRFEQSGQTTLIGLLPDNAQLPIPGNLPRLSIYVRIHLDAAGPIPKSISTKLIASDGTNVPLPGWSDDVVKKGFDDAKATGLPLVGFLMRSIFQQFPVTKPGVAKVMVSIDKKEFIAANINFRHVSS